jgi:hypothetical protein
MATRSAERLTDTQIGNGRSPPNPAVDPGYREGRLRGIKSGSRVEG